jgi:hypothetical protein
LNSNYNNLAVLNDGDRVIGGGPVANDVAAAQPTRLPYHAELWGVVVGSPSTGIGWSTWPAGSGDRRQP